MLYFTAEYLQPENISQSFKLLLTAVIIETVTTVFGLLGITDSIGEKSDNLMSRFLSRSGTKVFQMQKPEALVMYHDQIMTAVAVVAFVSFFVLIIA